MDGLIAKLSNRETELAVISSLIEDPCLVSVCIENNLKVNDFFDEINKKIYTSICSLYSNNMSIDVTSIVHDLRKNNVKVNVPDLVNYVVYSISSNIQTYISILKDLSYKRKIAIELYKFLGDISSNDCEVLKNQLEEIVEIADNSNSIERLFVDASDVVKEKEEGGLQVGFKKIDECTNGLPYGTLTILTGEPSSGKSTILNQIIAHNISCGSNAFIYSGELTENNVLRWFTRTVSNVNDIQAFSGINGQYYDVNKRGEHLIMEWMRNKLYIYKQASQSSIDNITSTISYLAKNKNVKLFILDNLMTVENSGVEELEKQKMLARKLKKLAQMYKVCVILVAHPKKKEFGRKGVHMHDVSGASEVVNLADYEFLLTREIKETESGRSDSTFFHILKNRTTGLQGMKIQLYFDSIRKRFYMDKSDLSIDYGYDKDKQVGFVEINDVDDCDVPF